ncbi:IS5 family transposase [Roseovarius sp.]|uniref:IS5 family transposase n=1 Tax=Roseovarius sp. TaxID=1486281 RepID=UPI003BA85224
MRQSFTTQPALFASHELFEHPALGALDAVEEVIDWSRIEALLPRGEERRQTGRPGYPAQTLFRALLLGLWYDLSDVKLSAQLARDLLFRKFCRLELDQGVPEASTLGRFRARLGDRLEAVLAEVVAMLEEARVVLAEGRIAIIDATVVEAAQSGYDRRDPEAGSAVKLTVKGRRRAVWGWQAFVNADEDGFVRRVAVSPGNRAEVDSLEDLVVGDEAALYADGAYSSPRSRALVARTGMADRVQQRGAKHKRLGPQDKARNVEIGVTRARVEAIFGHWKRHWGLRRTRFLGLAKMRILTGLAAVGWNLWKGARFRSLYG